MRVSFYPPNGSSLDVDAVGKITIDINQPYSRWLKIKHYFERLNKLLFRGSYGRFP